MRGKEPARRLEIRIANEFTSIGNVDSRFRTYQIYFHLRYSSLITVGRLGAFEFEGGDYVYTGSAVRNIAARVRRHLRKEKKLKWHIDYLLTNSDARIKKVLLSTLSECQLNKNTAGHIVIPGFGASDCKSHCVSHLKKL